MIFIITRANGEVFELSSDNEKTLLLNSKEGDVVRLKRPEEEVVHQSAETQDKES